MSTYHFLNLIQKQSGSYVLKTEGWSIDNVNELQELFDRINKVIQGDKNDKI